MNIVKSSVAGTMESSDIMITLEPGSGGIELDLKSQVEKQFGRQIRSVIINTLSELQVKSAKVTAVDKGAMDCTIKARVETAVRRAAFASQAEESAVNWRAPK